ncbi:hypothetical protein [Bradyrhizobium sp. B120]|uniref:hypothetical protein n=1 Tax=Bradyrhizobium sp. B120 TaxID=3410088 RepID=UPI003B97DB16
MRSVDFAMACRGAISPKTAPKCLPTALLDGHEMYNLSRGLPSRGAAPRVNVNAL